MTISILQFNYVGMRNMSGLNHTKIYGISYRKFCHFYNNNNPRMHCREHYILLGCFFFFLFIEFFVFVDCALKGQPEIGMPQRQSIGLQSQS